MTPRRRETTAHHIQPVRFYKAVALTFLCFTLLLLGVILFMSTKWAVITIEAKAEALSVSGIIEVSDTAAAGSLAGSVTSTVMTLSESASPAGGREVEGVAGGVVMLHNETSFSQVLVATTRLLTPKGILFRLRRRVEIPALGTIEAEVYADQAGESGNIGPSRFTIPGLSSERQKVMYATSEATMLGGVRHVGIVSIDDRKQAEERMIQKLLEEGKKRLEGHGIGRAATYSLVQYSVKVEPEVGTETDSMKASGRGTIAAVFYDSPALRAYAMRMLERQAVDDQEVIQPRRDEPTAAIEDIDIVAGRATLNVSFDGLATVNPQSPLLEKTLFFGKTKEDIRRSILSLDHVQGVSVDFMPAWVTRVPYSPDHVQVIVKQMQ